eukprot:1438683-Prymnesium_polylepis.1
MDDRVGRWEKGRRGEEDEGEHVVKRKQGLAGSAGGVALADVVVCTHQVPRVVETSLGLHVDSHVANDLQGTCLQ